MRSAVPLNHGFKTKSNILYIMRNMSNGILCTPQKHLAWWLHWACAGKGRLLHCSRCIHRCGKTDTGWFLQRRVNPLVSMKVVLHVKLCDRCKGIHHATSTEICLMLLDGAYIYKKKKKRVKHKSRQSKLALEGFGLEEKGWSTREKISVGLRSEEDYSVITETSGITFNRAPTRQGNCLSNQRIYSFNVSTDKWDKRRVVAVINAFPSRSYGAAYCSLIMSHVGSETFPPFLIVYPKKNQQGWVSSVSLTRVCADRNTSETASFCFRKIVREKKGQEEFWQPPTAYSLSSWAMSWPSLNKAFA